MRKMARSTRAGPAMNHASMLSRRAPGRPLSPELGFFGAGAVAALIASLGSFVRVGVEGAGEALGPRRHEVG